MERQEIFLNQKDKTLDLRIAVGQSIALIHIKSTPEKQCLCSELDFFE